VALEYRAKVMLEEETQALMVVRFLLAVAGALGQLV